MAFVGSPALSTSVFLCFAAGCGTINSQRELPSLSRRRGLRSSPCFLLIVPGGAIMLCGLALFVAEGSSTRALSGEGSRPNCGMCDMKVLKRSAFLLVYFDHGSRCDVRCFRCSPSWFCPIVVNSCSPPVEAN
jgi:hypothetical protein